MIQIEVVFDAGFTDSGKKISTMKAKHPPRTATHKAAKNAITHGNVLNTARVRKKNRRDVNTIVAEEKMITNLSSMTHIESDDKNAEEKSEVGYEIVLENLNMSLHESPVTKKTADAVYPKQHNLLFCFDSRRIS